MTDRLQEIRARLDAATKELATNLLFGRCDETAAIDFITNAPDDVAFLLQRVQLLEDSHAMYQAGATSHVTVEVRDA